MNDYFFILISNESSPASSRGVQRPAALGAVLGLRGPEPQKALVLRLVRPRGGGTSHGEVIGSEAPLSCPYGFPKCVEILAEGPRHVFTACRDGRVRKYERAVILSIVEQQLTLQRK